MMILNGEETRKALPWGPLIAAIEEIFRGDCVTPLRHHHDMAVPGEADATMLLMPAWLPGAYAGVKILNLFPDNHRRALPTIIGNYLLSSARTGEMLALVEGGELTARRTAATSALAAKYLARADAETLLVVGTGRLSLNLCEAHAIMRPIRRVLVWGRDGEKATEVAEAARALGLAATAAGDLAAAVAQADIVSCATLAPQALIRGEWLRPGTHLDLIGAFRPDMRESDDEAVRRAAIFVDTRAGALKEGGDLVQPIASGVIGADAVKAELAELVRGEHPGRPSPDAITLFKSVGAAQEDLAGAILAYENSRAEAGSGIFA